ncbi:MAG: NAD(P)-dependent oxidoreductase, partial [Solirubrobacteraceae bacterium]|nr:NAD(P)-dependent oxidoreductase [Solirubrobacteraceae bacterium]
TRDKADPLTEFGVTVVDDAREAVRGADVVLTMLLDADTTTGVLFGDDGALAARDEASVWLQMGTLGERGTKSCIDYAAEHGIPFVDAPVVGTKGPAMAGELVPLASGDDALRDRVQPVLDAVGKETKWLGAAGEGSKMKLVVNSWFISIVEATAETFALADSVGVDPRDFMAIMEGGPLDVKYLGMKGQKILDEDWEPQFGLTGAAKDARLIAELGREHGASLPMFEAIAQRFTEGAEDHGEKDAIASYLAARAASS